jgi:hypothetical protein
MATADQNNTLPSLPLELKLKIFRHLLGSWKISVEHCCNRIEKTTPARPYWSEEDAEKLGLFHVCHNVRATATLLIGECLKLTFDGDCSQECLDHDHARPLPHLLRNNVRHITLSLWDDHMDRSSIEAFSSLESVTFEDGYQPIDILHISWSRNWAVYVPSVKYQDSNLCQLAFDELVKHRDWMWNLYEDKTRKWRLIYKGGIHFPNIVGEETKTMVCCLHVLSQRSGTDSVNRDSTCPPMLMRTIFYERSLHHYRSRIPTMVMIGVNGLWRYKTYGN